MIFTCLFVLELITRCKIHVFLKNFILSYFCLWFKWLRLHLPISFSGYNNMVQIFEMFFISIVARYIYHLQKPETPQSEQCEENVQNNHKAKYYAADNPILTVSTDALPQEGEIREFWWELSIRKQRIHKNISKESPVFFCLFLVLTFQPR